MDKWDIEENEIDDLCQEEKHEEFEIPEEQIQQAKEIETEFKKMRRDRLRAKLRQKRDQRINGTPNINIDESSLKKMENCTDFKEFANKFINSSNLGESEKISIKNMMQKINKI